MADFGSGSGDGAGGAGNGNGAGAGRGWDGTDSEPDDDGTGSDHGFSDGDADGSGSGQGPSSGGDWEEKSDVGRSGKKPGKMTTVNNPYYSMTLYLHLGSDEFELNGGETTPRVTVNEPTGGSGSASSDRTSISAALLAVCLLLTLNLPTTSSFYFRSLPLPTHWEGVRPTLSVFFFILKFSRRVSTKFKALAA